ncbi:MAG: cation transporter dimerization domain-containing protein, partial [Oscillospiraceae bacterium]
DGYIGVLVAIFILISGFNTIKDTLNPLLGSKPTPEFVNEITSCVLAHSEIVGIHDLIVHNYGPARCMLSLHAEVPSTLDVLQAHDAIAIIEYELKEKFKCDAIIHMDPIIVDDEVSNKMKTFIKSLVVSINPQLSIHDFRMTKGPLHSNLIFDLVIPFDCIIKDELIKEKINEEILKLDQTYYTVINIDREYI